ncbi:hypothetical protein V8D89_015698 [Ganoderma adspersum]
MCYYEIPVMQWSLCRHARPLPAVQRHCNFQQDPSTPPSSRMPIPEACSAPRYIERYISFEGLCTSCAWGDYHRRLEAATARWGAEVSPLVERPPYLIPSYRVCAWPELSGCIGLAPTPKAYNDDMRRARAMRIAGWVLLQRRYQYEAVQRNSLCAMEGAPIESFPVGWLETTHTHARLMVLPRTPANQGAGNARIESGRERAERGLGGSWRR